MLYADAKLPKLIRDVQRNIRTTRYRLAVSAPNGGFKASKPYRAYREGALDPRKAGAEMDLLDVGKDQVSDAAPVFATPVKRHANWPFR
ncbi:hypothetical protein [uncultured Tateyamaria sp.]|uniref:hypothetical protein n=1 Tax=uncultured Tateyamaria sp. TaxID=455651 RepID=UPI00260621ED|nr:hypothetical protein [uncultured Tateyamaria sp.]